MSSDGDPGAACGRNVAVSLHIVDEVHALSNALTTILGLADWHLATADLPEPLRGDLSRIVDAARRAEAATGRLRLIAGRRRRQADQAPAAVPPQGAAQPGCGSAA